MAVTLGADRDGPYVLLDCDWVGCGCHVAVRPADPSRQGPVDCIYEVGERATALGWLVVGRALCREHFDAWLDDAACVYDAREGAYDGPGQPEGATQPVQPVSRVAVAQRGLTGVH